MTKVHVEVAQDAARRLRDRDDRPPRPPRGRGHHGAGDARHVPGRDASRTWRSSTSRDPTQPRLRDADHAVGGRRARRSSPRCKARFPAIRGPKKDDICYATQNRQDAVKFMAPQCDVVIVVGSPNSSNSNRLREVARAHGRAGLHGGQRRRAEAASGSPASGASASPPAPRRRRCWCNELIERLQALGAAERAAARGHHRERGVHAAARAGAALAAGRRRVRQSFNPAGSARATAPACR